MLGVTVQHKPIKPPAEERLVDFFVPSGKILDPSSMSYFPNVTGFIRGSCSMHNITSAAMQDSPTIPWENYARDLMTSANMTEITERLGSWNWTASEKVTMSVVEKIPESKPDSKGKGRKPQPPSDIAMVHVCISPFRLGLLPLISTLGKNRICRFQHCRGDAV